MRHLVSLGAAILLFGCSGNYTIGKAQGNQTGDGGPTGGKGSGGDITGSGGASAGGAIGKGGAIGGGGVVGNGGVTGGECTDPGQCAVPAVCQVCPNGGYSCAKADCINGKCQTVFEPCGSGGSGGGGGTGECTANTDCVQFGAPCQMCPDGSTACPKVECIGGKCVGSFPGCSGTACDPSQCPVPPPNAKPCCISTSGPCCVDFLNGSGCVSPPNPGGCQTDFDCPVLASCKLCPDGSCAPVSAKCESGQCVTTYGTCGTTGSLQWYTTCGDPICRSPGSGGSTSGYPPCDPAAGQKVGGPCDKDGDICDPGSSCGEMLMCATSDPTHGGACPISRAKFKTDIEYVSSEERAKLADDVQSIPLVRYRYKDAPERAHLGFIIEDIEPSPSVDSNHDRVDLYGYTSMAVAAIQEQKRAIEELKREVRDLRAELAKRSAK
jgi:hypothetical protein